VRETDGRPGAWSANRVKADAQGRFAFRDVPPDLVCTLVTLHPRREPAAVHGCRPGSEVPLRFAAPRTR